MRLQLDYCDINIMLMLCKYMHVQMQISARLIIVTARPLQPPC